ncbi:aspartate kinase [Floricoccus penangensis]|uniref:aspartate kinase n=1 Tax=Floricoccus penangensis TaxID=1859475 RepID=UPI0020402D39|nr:aspartate kinase [Floricoccus penangensis]URZ86819.1 aspartate kinase [Floricoccus penangensis]
MKVVKFGGSSVASAPQIDKVFNIIKSDPNRKFVVVSAPGKRFAEDTKVTDALIAYYDAVKNGGDIEASQNWLIDRYSEITTDLNLSDKIIEEIKKNILSLADLDVDNDIFAYDSFLAAGENNNAILIAEYFDNQGLKAQYINPKEAGIFVTEEPGDARLLDESDKKINELNNLDGVLVIPGFFGITEKGKVCTFSRGGSDITGSIVAAGTKADIYENFTDVDGIFVAHPGIIENPESISEVTYKEMRELSYAGFSVLHDEALVPARLAGVPIVIKNTNNPDHPGTKITTERKDNSRPVIGIAAESNFSSINISKYLMNREVGFGRKVLQSLEDNNIRFEHMPTGIDDLSVIIRSRFLTPSLEEKVLTELHETLNPDELHLEKDLSVIVIVGEGMKEHIGVTSTATRALSDAGINLEMLSQGSSEVSVMFVVKGKQEKEAITALYNAFF